MSLDFKLDKKAFSTLSFEDANKSITDYSNYTWKERLIIANRLIAIAYNFPLDNPPRMDKSYFSSRKLHG